MSPSIFDFYLESNMKKIISTTSDAEVELNNIINVPEEKVEKYRVTLKKGKKSFGRWLV
jgi:hypothetical protein